MVVTHPKEGEIFWTCVKYNFVGEKEEYKAMELSGFYHKIYDED